MAKDKIEAVGHRLRELRMARGLTLDAMAEKLSAARGEPVHFTTVGKIERSQRTISLDWILAFAEALGVRPHELLGGPASRGVRMLPVIGLIAAGNWREAIEEPITEIPVPDDVGPNAFGLQPSGDSMNLLLSDHGYVVVDPDQLDLAVGKVFAVMNSQGEATLKRYRSDPPRLEPVSDNPDHHPIPIGREPFTVIGRVTFELRKM